MRELTNAMHRRGFLSGVAGLTGVVATRSIAAEHPPSAVEIVRPVMPPQDISSLIITDIEGMPVHLAAYFGRIIVLNLWASWCPPCRREMPSLSRLADLVDPDQITVLPLAFDKANPARAQRFFKRAGITNLPVLLGDGENLKAVFGQGLLPTTLILDKVGQHIYTAKGEANWDDAPTLKWLNYLASKSG